VSTENAADPLSQRPERDAGLPLVGQVCPQCGGYLKAGRARCTKCSGEARAKQVPPGPAVANGGWFQFSIETLLLVTTLIAVCLGACVAVPPIGIPLTAIALVAFVRTLVIGQHHRAVGLTFSAGEKSAEFLVSLVIVAGAVGVAFLAFFGIGIVCWMIAVLLFNFGPPRTPAAQLSYSLLGLAFWLAMILGPITAGVWFLRTTRPRG
jgi:hypothetical protein